MVIMAIVAVVARVGAVVALMCAAFRGGLLRAAFRSSRLLCAAFRSRLLCAGFRSRLLCAAFWSRLLCAAFRDALMRTAARESRLALRTEAVPVSCKARLGSPDIRYRVTAEPEGIMSASIAYCLGRRRARIPGHGIGQQSEHDDRCEPNASHLNIFHLARSLYDPPRLTVPPSRAGEESRGTLYSPKMRLLMTGQGADMTGQGAARGPGRSLPLPWLQERVGSGQAFRSGFCRAANALIG
jgi:hypothetical protein